MIINVVFRRGGSCNDIAPTDGNSIPDGVTFVRIRSQFDSSFAKLDYDCNTFVDILKKHSMKIPTIDLKEFDELCPEYLALLVTCFGKAECLCLTDGLVGDAGYSCLMSCFLQQDGPTELEFHARNNDFSTSQAQLFFGGIGYSSTLKQLNVIRIEDEPSPFADEQAGRALVDALRRNRGLESLWISNGIFYEDASNEIMPRVFEVAIMETQVRDLDIEQCSIPYDTMVEVLCREDCSLEKLSTKSVRYLPQSSSQFAKTTDAENMPKNSSVKKCAMHYAGLESARVMDVLGIFTSLVDLDLSGNQIEDLSPFDPLLLGDNLTLRRLVLSENNIGDNEAAVFFRKIPNMKCLRVLDMDDNLFLKRFFHRRRLSLARGTEDNSEPLWLSVLADISWRNIPLDQISLGTSEWYYDPLIWSKVCVPLWLNRGGRRDLEPLDLSSNTPIGENLWPLVLQRAGKISYCNPGLHWRPELDKEKPELNVVYWLLREKVQFLS
mmetsp:Transcript_42248/g.102097  ORF Transcript_42248/g.102097 Transcript_42248/m.102097 type:complete len:495 (+) Transcript_42248:42-1526(+)